MLVIKETCIAKWKKNRMNQSSKQCEKKILCIKKRGVALEINNFHTG